MANNVTHATKAAICNYFFIPGTEAPTRPLNLYLALFTTPTGLDGSGTEVVGVNYARQEVLFGAPFVVDNKVRIANTTEISFPVAGGPWGTVTHGAIFDASSLGQMLLQGPLPEPVTINFNELYRISVGSLVFDIS